jgi:hypothetical protein
LLDQLAARLLKARREHPWVWQAIDFLLGAALTAMAWLVIGRVAGIVFAAVWAFLMVVGLIGQVGLSVAKSRGHGG